MRRLAYLRIVVLAGVLMLLLIVAIWVNGALTTWIEGDKFRELLEHETGKGLHVQAAYVGVRRTSFLGLHVDSFTGSNGLKTIVSLQANDITGSFAPSGILWQQWQLNDLHGKSGVVMLQKTEATPGAAKSPGRPWWGYFWPYRVQLQDIKIDDANVLWKLEDKESGIYHTFLEVTPNGHDFEYDARGGDFETPMTPALTVVHAHLLIRKPRLYCTEFVLGDDPAQPAHGIKLTGDAGLQDDRSIHLQMDMNALNVPPWLPAKLRRHVRGQAQGHFDYQSTGTGIETAVATGTVSMANGVLHELAPVHKYVTITGSPDPGDMSLKVCQAGISYKDGATTIDQIQVECEDVFRLEGSFTLSKDKSLSGTLELGLTSPYLRWLPTAKSAIFTRADGPYHFATIHLSGTAEKPQQDLGARVAKEVEKSPLLALKLFFKTAVDWFNFD